MSKRKQYKPEFKAKVPQCKRQRLRHRPLPMHRMRSAFSFSPDLDCNAMKSVDNVPDGL